MKLFYDTGTPQIPLYLRLDARPYWGDVQEALDLPKKEMAAVALAFYDNGKAGHWTSYSRRNDQGGAGFCNGLMTRRNVAGTADFLDDMGLVENQAQCPGGRGHRSALKPLPEMLDLLDPIFPDLGRVPLMMPDRAAIIRRKDGTEIQPTNRAAFERIERPVWAANEMLMGTDIRNGKGLDIRCPVRRIFNGDLQHGGRLFTMGGISYQNMPRDERHDITINGEPTVELDFKAIHPHILYNQRGLPVPADCYAIARWPRDLVKLALLVLINAENLKDVIGVLSNSDGETIVRDEDGGIIDITTERKLMKQITGGDQKKAIAFAHALVQDVKEYHAPIADAFHSNAGVKLMNKDSEIAMNVMRIMGAIGEPVLSVHDSFLVRKSMQDKLHEIMEQAAEMAGVHGIKIEAKTRH